MKLPGSTCLQSMPDNARLAQREPSCKMHIFLGEALESFFVLNGFRLQRKVGTSVI